MSCTSLTWWRNVEVNEIPSCTWVWSDTVTLLYREMPEFIPQRYGHPVCHNWIRWSTASGSTGCMIWRSWQNVCWGSGGCWTTPSSWQWLHSGVVFWVHFVFVWMVDFLNTKFWTCDHLVCFVRFIDTGLRKFDRQAPINMCKVLILSEMCYFLHSTVATKRMSGRKFSYCVPWHSLAKWCTKNCENSFTFVKVTAKKSVALF